MTVSTCGRCGMLVESRLRRCPGCGRRHPALFGLRPWLDRLFPLDRPLARPLALFLVALYLVTLLLSRRRGDIPGTGFEALSPGAETLVNYFGALFTPAVTAHGEWWRLVTSCLLHANPLHILFNAFALFQLGPLVESIYGPARFTILFVVAGVTGYLASLPFVDLTIGASGSLFGFIGAAIAYGIRRGGTAGDSIRAYGIQWLIIGLAYGLFMRGINNWAHGGGALAGFALAWFFDPTGPHRGRESDSARLLALAALLVTLTSILFAAHFALFSPHYR